MLLCKPQINYFNNLNSYNVNNNELKIFPFDWKGCLFVDYLIILYIMKMRSWKCLSFVLLIKSFHLVSELFGKMSHLPNMGVLLTLKQCCQLWSQILKNHILELILYSIIKAHPLTMSISNWIIAIINS